MAKRMSKKGKGANAFKSNSSTSNSAPRAPGPAGKGGNWRAGVPHIGQAGRLFAGAAMKVRAARQGSSVANMGDGCTSNGHNVPRGYFANAEVARGAAAGGSLFKGSTPLAKTGKKKGKVYPAAKVTGPWF